LLTALEKPRSVNDRSKQLLSLCRQSETCVSSARMTWRAGVRPFILQKVPVRARQFASFCRPNVPRINNAVIVPVGRSTLYDCTAIRRGLFGIGKKQTETSPGPAVKAVKSFGRVCYRFALYSTVFIWITVTGFFLYDVSFLCQIPLYF